MIFFYGESFLCRWLTLEGNLLTSVPAEIAGLENLIHLNLSNNKFEKLPNLEELKVIKFIRSSKLYESAMHPN